MSEMIDGNTTSLLYGDGVDQLVFKRCWSIVKWTCDPKNMIPSISHCIVTLNTLAANANKGLTVCSWLRKYIYRKEWREKNEGEEVRKFEEHKYFGIVGRALKMVKFYWTRTIYPMCHKRFTCYISRPTGFKRCCNRLYGRSARKDLDFHVIFFTRISFVLCQIFCHHVRCSEPKGHMNQPPDLS